MDDDDNAETEAINNNERYCWFSNDNRWNDWRMLLFCPNYDQLKKKMKNAGGDEKKKNQ